MKRMCCCCDAVVDFVDRVCGAWVEEIWMRYGRLCIFRTENEIIKNTTRVGVCEG